MKAAVGFRSKTGRAIAVVPTLPLYDVRVVSPDHVTVRAIRSLASRHKVEGRRLHTVVDRHWIEDAYVYRAVPAAAA